MPYDLFVSHAEADAQGRITQLAERIKTDFAPFARGATRNSE